MDRRAKDNTQYGRDNLSHRIAPIFHVTLLIFGASMVHTASEHHGYVLLRTRYYQKHEKDEK